MERPARAPVRSILAYVAVAGVLLVLALVAIVVGPLLTVGTPIELPRTSDRMLAASDESITVSIDRNGILHVGEKQVGSDELEKYLAREAGARDKPVFVRADSGAAYQTVARVMTQLSTAGFTKVTLIGDEPVADEEG